MKERAKLKNKETTTDVLIGCAIAIIAIGITVGVITFFFTAGITSAISLFGG